MDQSEIKNEEKKALFLGVDGGQSHTEAIIADAGGKVLGRGVGGPSNHAEQPGGRERLRNAILGSVGQALAETQLPEISNVEFISAHFGMTGGADYKEEIIGELVNANNFVVGHDAPTALFGATSGEPGIVVIAGTGSVVYGENSAGENTQIGGLGYLFSDEGSGFWLALQTIRLAIKEQDGLITEAGLQQLVLDFFGKTKIREVTNDFYHAKMSRDVLASFAKVAHDAAEAGNAVIREQVEFGANVLAESVRSAAGRLGLTDSFLVAGVGGMFRSALMKKYFSEALETTLPKAKFINPRFNPTIGAVLIAYRQAGIEISKEMLLNLEAGSR